MSDCPVKIPRYHDLLAAGVGEKQAMAWHNAIMTLESHAVSMADAIAGNADDLKQRVGWFREAHGYMK